MNSVNEVKVLAPHPLTQDGLQRSLLAEEYEFVPLILHVFNWLKGLSKISSHVYLF